MIKHALASSAFAAGTLLAAAAMANTPMPAQPASGMHARQYNRSGMRYDRGGEPVGNLYTHALNTLYAHGLHGVHDMAMQNGVVHATGITSRGRRVQVAVAAGSDRVEKG